jgi:hypothetical protein
VVTLRSLERIAPTPVINKVSRGYLEIKEGRLSTFTMIIVIGVEEFHYVARKGRLLWLRSQITDILRKYPISGIGVGTVAESGEFKLRTSMRYDDELEQ